MESIFKQDYPNIELVVCDDCSADFDAAEVERYILDNKSENIRKVSVFQQDHNVGIVQNAQKGVELSSGAYFKLHAADDMLENNCVLTTMENLIKAPKTGAVSARSVACMNDCTTTEHYYPSLAGTRKALQNTEPQEQFVILATMPAEECYHGTALYWKREAFDALGGFDLHYRHVEDLTTLLRLTAAGWQIAVTDSVTTVYRYGGALNRGYVGVRREFYSAYYGEIARALQEYALPTIKAQGRQKKTVRCQQLIRSIEIRAYVLPDWENRSWWQQLGWCLQNLDYLLLRWLYNMSPAGFRTKKTAPLKIMAAAALMFAFHAEIWPGIQRDRLWAGLFFAATLWLLICVLVDALVGGLNMLRGKRLLY